MTGFRDWRLVSRESYSTGGMWVGSGLSMAIYHFKTVWLSKEGKICRRRTTSSIHYGCWRSLPFLFIMSPTCQVPPYFPEGRTLHSRSNLIPEIPPVFTPLFVSPFLFFVIRSLRSVFYVEFTMTLEFRLSNWRGGHDTGRIYYQRLGGVHPNLWSPLKLVLTQQKCRYRTTIK